MIKAKYITCLVIMLFIQQFKTLYACDCTTTPLKNHIKETSDIIVGEIVSLLDTKEEREGLIFSRPDLSYRVKIRIKDSLKGDLGKDQVIELGSDYSNCDVAFKNSENYLLFLVKKGNVYYNRPCSYSGLKEASIQVIKIVKTTLRVK